MARLLMSSRNAGTAASVGVTAGYTCKEKQGAALDLKSSALEEKLLKSVSVRRYMRSHHHEWHEFARDVLDVDVRPEQVVLVVGTIKTAADWKAVALSHLQSDSHASLTANAANFGGAGLSTTFSREVKPSRVRREGVLYHPKCSTASAADESRREIGRAHV